MTTPVDVDMNGAQVAPREDDMRATKANGKSEEKPANDAVPLTVDTLIASVKSDPAALLSDESIAFSSRLDELPLARLKSALRDAKTKGLADWERIIKSERGARAAAAAQANADHADSQRAADPRPIVAITEDEHEVNAAATTALAALPDVYSRAGELVRVVDAKRRRPGEADPYVVSEIRIITEPYLRHLLSRAVRWTEDGDRSHVPEWSVRAIRAAGAWPEVRPLYHVATAPTLLPDGRLLQEPGYDAATGILYQGTMELDDVPEAPTREEARAASLELTELVSEVPFESDAHQSAWLAGLLTVVARFAFKGQSPFFMFDANREGTGKGFLVRIISAIALGRDCDLLVQTADEEEERKRITSKVMTGQPMVLIDEIDKPFGTPSLQALLTTGTWSDRILGSNDSPSIDVSTVWFGAGNNVGFKSNDIRRRTCLVRLVTQVERPEERSGWRIPVMADHIAEHRARLFRAALVMLRGWLCSGMKPTDLEGWGGAWGSVDDWDRVVRGAIVYAGHEDPIAVKATKVESMAKEGLPELVLGLAEAAEQLGKDAEVSVSVLHAALCENDEDRKAPRRYDDGAVPLRFSMLRKGLHSLLPHLRGQTPSGAVLGTLLGRNKQQSVPIDGGRKWIVARKTDGENLWRAEFVPGSEVPIEGVPF